MKKINKFFAVLLVFSLLFGGLFVLSFAKDDFAKTYFMVFLKEEYCTEVQSVIDSIDSEYIGEVRELTNPDDYDEPYTPMLLVWVKDKNEAYFENALKYFDHKEYTEKTEYDYSCSIDDTLHGDTDGDGKFTAKDARFILRCSVGLEVCDKLQRCDADADGKITAADARYVLRMSVGLSGC